MPKPKLNYTVLYVSLLESLITESIDILNSSKSVSLNVLNGNEISFVHVWIDITPLVSVSKFTRMLFLLALKFPVTIIMKSFNSINENDDVKLKLSLCITCIQWHVVMCDRLCSMFACNSSFRVSKLHNYQL